MCGTPGVIRTRDQRLRRELPESEDDELSEDDALDRLFGPPHDER